MHEQVEQFLRSLQVDKNYSANTVAAYGNDLDQLATFLERTTAGSNQQLIQMYGRHLKEQTYAVSTGVLAYFVHTAMTRRGNCH